MHAQAQPRAADSALMLCNPLRSCKPAAFLALRPYVSKMDRESYLVGQLSLSQAAAAAPVRAQHSPCELCVQPCPPGLQADGSVRCRHHLPIWPGAFRCVRDVCKWGSDTDQGVMCCRHGAGVHRPVRCGCPQGPLQWSGAGRYLLSSLTHESSTHGPWPHHLQAHIMGDQSCGLT